MRAELDLGVQKERNQNRQALDDANARVKEITQLSAEELHRKQQAFEVQLQSQSAQHQQAMQARPPICLLMHTQGMDDGRPLLCTERVHPYFCAFASLFSGNKSTTNTLGASRRHLMLNFLIVLPFVSIARLPVSMVFCN